MRKVIETPVLIVGAGPIGLSMSIELGWRGVPNTLVDMGDGTLEHPRTGLIAVRTMELFRRWGFAQRIRDCGFPEDYELSMVFCTSLNGLRLDKEYYPGMRETPTPPETPEKKQRCPQLWMQPILTQRALEEPNSSVLFKHRFERLEQDDAGVTAFVLNLGSNQIVEFRSKYLIASDGALSGVREHLGVGFTGKLLSYSVNVLLRVPNLTAQHRMGEAERYLFVGPKGTWGNLTVVDGSDIWRLTVLGNSEKMDLTAFDAKKWVEQALGSSNINYEILSVQPWRRSEMLADKFVVNRVVLVGDSLHTMSPTGGMGMNTGMQEVLDLGWKIEGAVNGWGGTGLVPSFEAERKPVAARNISFSTQNFKAWMNTPDPKAVCDETEEGVRTRAAVGLQLKESTRVEWESLGLQIGHRYEGSPICISDGCPPTRDEYSEYVPTSRPGSRAPHFWMKDGRSTLDIFGKTFVLMVFNESKFIQALELASAFKSKNVPLKVESLDEPVIAAAYERDLVLVRPDGHVAWRGDTVNQAEGIVDTVRGAP